MLEEQDRIELLRLARSTIECYLTSGTTLRYHASRPALATRSAAFVSLHNGDELRGCIGQLTADRELYLVVQHCAVCAATEDLRFSPVTGSELPGLTIEISVLSPFRPEKNIENIEVGKHGLYVVKGSHHGLLLPQVATQYNWDRRTFLTQTCRKAGLVADAWKDPETIVHIFEAEVFSE